MSTPPTLLVADDSVMVQRVVTLTFADQPIRVVVARDGQDAINRMATERPDVVLADTNMPCVDGYDLARWVREQPHLRAVPVLLLAGATDPVDEQRLHDSGANGVLEKPFEPTHVISRVKELLGLKGPSPAPAARLVTSLDPVADRRSPIKVTSPAAAAPETTRSAALTVDSRPEPAPHAVAVAPSPAGGAVDEFHSGAPVDDVFDAYDAGVGAGDRPAAVELLERAEDAGVRVGGADVQAGSVDASADRFGSHDRDIGRGSSEEGGPRANPAAEAAGPEGARNRSPARLATGGGVRIQLPRQPAPADVFETLLAAEQGDARAVTPTLGSVVVQAAAPEITDEMLDALADRVSERVQGPLVAGLREMVARTVRDSLATEARAAVAEAVQAAVDGSILGTLRGAVSESVAAAVPAAVAQHRELVEASVQRVVRDAVLAAVPPAMADAVRAEVGGRVREIVHETSERLVSEEIARIRGRRG